MGFGKSEPPTAPVEAGSADELDYMEEDLEEQAEQPADSHEFDGPRAWEDVEETESQRVSLSISTHAVPSNDSGEAAARLAWQAAVLESENQDPLGLGRIDAHGLRLVRQERTTARLGAAKRNDTLTKRGNINRRGTKEAADEAVRMAAIKPFLDLSGDLSEYRLQVMPTKDSFDAVIYLAVMHGDTALADLKLGHQNLNFEATERTGQLKSLVKENFERFISCKSTIDDIHSRLRKAEGDYGEGADGASTADMVTSVNDVQQDAKRAVASMLERAGMTDRIKNVMSLLVRYEALFRLPSRVQQETERGEFGTVVSEYRKARGIMADVAAENAPEGVWHNLFQEVDKGVDVMVAKLTNSLRGSHISPRQAADAIKHLLHLHAEGARSCKHLDPVKLYLEAQAGHVQRLFSIAEEEHAAAVKSFRQQSAAQEASDANWQHSQLQAGGMQDNIPRAAEGRQTLDQQAKAPAASEAGTVPSAEEDSLQLQLLARMTGHVVTHLPNIWQLVQEGLPALGSISKAAQGMVEAGRSHAATMLQQVLNDYSAHVIGVLAQMTEGRSLAGTFLSAVQLIARGCQRVHELADLPGLLASLDKILHEAGALSIKNLRRRCLAAVDAQVLGEECAALPLQSIDADGPHSAAPGLLQAAMQDSLRQLWAVYAEAGQAGISTEEPLAADLRSTMQDCLAAFASSSHQAALLQQAHEEEADNEAEAAEQAPVPDAKLLALYSNCAYVRAHVMPALMARYGDWMAADGNQDAVQEVADQCEEQLQQAEEQTMSAYIDSKTRQLDPVLQDFLYGDLAALAHAPLPSQPREVCLELLFSLVDVRAEVHMLLPPQRQEVMQSLLQHILTTLGTSLQQQLAEVPVGAALQLLLELQYLHAAMTVYVSSRLEADFVRLGAKLTQQVQDMHEQLQNGQVQQLHAWLGKVQGTNWEQGMQAGLAQALVLSSQSQQLNLRAFQT